MAVSCDTELWQCCKRGPAGEGTQSRTRLAGRSGGRAKRLGEKHLLSHELEASQEPAGHRGAGVGGRVLERGSK